jgi:hypothetical protein
MVLMTGLRAPIPPDSTEHPLRAALARGDALRARSGPALQHLVAVQDCSLISEAVVAQVGGMLRHLADQIVDGRAVADPAAARERVIDSLLRIDALREHCQALALEWRLAVRLEAEAAVDPVLTPLLQTLVADTDAGVGALAMAVLAAQARFAQAQRRVQLPLAELPAELFHAVMLAAREMSGEGDEDYARAETRLRAAYDEGAGRLSLLARLMSVAGAIPSPLPAIEDAGVALWLSAVAARSGQDRDRTACAVADPSLGRLLLTLRAAGVAPAEAERQALRTQPDAVLPRGLQDIGTREAAQWLAAAQS